MDVGEHKDDPTMKVAVKEITWYGEDDLEKIKKEIKSERKFKSKHVCELKAAYKTKEDEKGIFLVLEYCNGGNLFNYFEKSKITENDIFEIISQILKPFVDHDEQKLIYGDIKPGNILVKIEDKKPIFKIAHFGSSRILSPSSILRTTFKGTPLYMSPEQLN